ncbi:hypothetical protein BGX31_007556 [Mortierella sp. GBA43]|nr:hypothetical protein BGX31_007556 [Mortierella sp. GBA43]
MPATAILPPHSTTASTTSSSTTQTTTNQPNTRRTGSTCPGCNGTNVFSESSIGGVVCHDCGQVLEDRVLDDTPGRDSGGLTRVDKRGRTWGEPSHPSSGHLGSYTIASPSEQRRLYRSKRFQQLRKHLSATGRLSGLSNDVNRAYFLWRTVMADMNLKFWDQAFRGAVACLFLASKERKRGVTLFGIAAKAGVSPFKVGAVYKQIKSLLLERQILDDDDGSLVDDDPRNMLEKIFCIGSSASIQRGEMDNLPQPIREVFGVDADDRERMTNLRSLWSSAQKCMAIAMDADLTTGRHPHALVAACLVVAVEVKLLITGYPKELVDFAAITFDSTPTTVRLRYRELKNRMLVWANRLPFITTGQTIKEKKLVYHLEDVLKYFGSLESRNKQLWAALDKNDGMESDHDDSDDENIDMVGQLEPEGGFTVDDLRLEKELRDSYPFDDTDEFGDVAYSDGDGPEPEQAQGTIMNQDQDPPNLLLGSKSRDIPVRDDQMYPPSFVAGLKLSEGRLKLLQVAKGEAEYPSKPPCKRSSKELMDLRRIDVIKRLLDLGYRNEQELLDACNGTLEYWLCADIARRSGLGEPRSKEEMDAVELGPKDLSQQELEGYLRTPVETQAVLRIMAPTFIEVEDQRRKRSNSHQPNRVQDPRQQQCTTKRASPPSAADQPAKNAKRVRSSKINWEAISDAEDETSNETLEETQDERSEWPKQSEQDYFGGMDEVEVSGEYDYDYDDDC